MALTHIQTSGYNQPKPPPAPPSPPILNQNQVSYITKSHAFNKLINDPQTAGGSPPSVSVAPPKLQFPNIDKSHNNQQYSPTHSQKHSPQRSQPCSPPTVSRPSSLPKSLPQPPNAPKVTNPFNVHHSPPNHFQQQHPPFPNGHAPPVLQQARYLSQPPQQLHVCYGDTVRLRDGRDGEVKFIGTIGYRDEIWYGIHLHSQTGNCNGIQQNRLFFQCPPGYGLFIPKHSISTIVSMVNHGMGPRFPIGTRVKCHSGRGIIKFIGEAPFGNNHGRKVLYGVELDKHAHGAHNGIYQNQIYFVTDYGRGLFLSEQQIMLDDRPNDHHIHHHPHGQHMQPHPPPPFQQQRQRSPRHQAQQRVFFGPPPPNSNRPPSPRAHSPRQLNRDAPPIPHYNPPPPPGPAPSGPSNPSNPSPLKLRDTKSNPLYPSNDQKRAHRTHVLRNTPSLSPKGNQVRLKLQRSHSHRPPSPSYRPPNFKPQSHQNQQKQQNQNQLQSPKAFQPPMDPAQSLTDDDSDASSLASNDQEEEVNAALKATNFQYIFEKC